MKEKPIRNKFVVISLLFLITMIVLTFYTRCNATIYTSISGKVIDDVTGKGVNKVIVTAESNDKTSGAITDIDGNYVVKDLPPGKYHMMFTKPNSQYIQAERPQFEVFLLSGKNVVNANFVMQTGVTLNGRILSEKGTNNVGITYTSIDPVLPWAAMTADGRVKIDSNGYFTIQGLPETDNFEIIAYIPGNVDKIKRLKISKEKPAYVEFLVNWNNATGIHGQVASSIDGKPLSKIRIEVRMAGSEEVLAGAVTDDAGRYSIVGMEPGTYEVSIFLSGVGFVKKTVTLKANESIGVNFALEKTARVSKYIGVIVNWLFSMLASDAMAEEYEYAWICNDSVKVAKKGYLKCTQGQRMALDSACIIAKNKVANSCADVKFKSWFDIKLESGDVVFTCSPNVNLCANNPDSKNPKPGCARATGWENIRWCEGAFSGRCGCLEAVELHEIIHLGQLIKEEIYPYTCENAIFSCGAIESEYLSRLGETCKYVPWWLGAISTFAAR